MKNILKHVPSIKAYCINNLNFDEKDQGYQYYYNNLSLCAIEAVFSIGVKYEGVLNTISNVCNYFSIPRLADVAKEYPSKEEQVSCKLFLKMIQYTEMDNEELAKSVFNNRQRTSTNNGILKVEASLRFIKTLSDFGAQYYQDVNKIINNETFENCIRQIPGQGSGISLKFFHMLVGDNYKIEAGTKVQNFFKEASGGMNLSLDECKIILLEICKELESKSITITPKQLDYLIWNYQRVKLKKI